MDSRLTGRYVLTHVAKHTNHSLWELRDGSAVFSDGGPPTDFRRRLSTTFNEALETFTDVRNYLPELINDFYTER